MAGYTIGNSIANLPLHTDGGWIAGVRLLCEICVIDPADATKYLQQACTAVDRVRLRRSQVLS